MSVDINQLIQSKSITQAPTSIVARYSLFLPDSLVYFEGHFDSLSLLPGVVQVRWAMELLPTLIECDDFISVERLKFVRPILPNSIVDLVLTYSSDSNTCVFEFSNNSGKFSSGKVVLG